MRSMPSSRMTLAARSSTIRILAFRISAGPTMVVGLDSLGAIRLLPGEIQRYVHRMHELTDLDWLGQIAEEPRLQALLDVARHCICAEGDNWNMGRRRVFAKESQGFDATDAGQIDVHQDHLGLVDARKLDARSSVPRAQQAHIVAACDELLDQLQVRGVVLYIEQRAQRRAVL